MNPLSSGLEDRPCRGDFGYGWRLEESESSVQVSRPLGEGIAIWSRIGPFAFPCTEVFEQKQHSVEIRLSDDEFELQPR